jgi:NRPS condensation-like uncharacterized protein
MAEGSDPIRPWYEAVRATGDYHMIRFGHLRPGSSDVRWVSIPHSEFDGIGGFTHLLREKGVTMDKLPENPHPSNPSWWPFIRSIPKILGPRRRLAWKELEQGPPVPDGELPDPVLAWHVFSEDQTRVLREAARVRSVTVNSLLMKHLDTVLRRDIVDPGAAVPWMVPVNLRGKVSRGCDTQNHSSYVSVRVAPGDTMQDLHAEIRRRLKRGEHWANWKAYSATRFLPPGMKEALVKADRAMAEWNFGLFTNLGVWDPEKRITHEYFAGTWMAAATVLRCQTVGAALMTYQGKLSLTLQVHPDVTTAQSVPDRWLAAWLDEVRQAEPSLGNPGTGA